MPATKPKIHKILWKTPSTGSLIIAEPCAENLPPIFLDGDLLLLVAGTPQETAVFTGYFLEEDRVVFVLHPLHYPRTDIRGAPPTIAGSFNQWQKSLDNPYWQLRPTDSDNWTLALPRSIFAEAGPHEFKFITADNQWLEPPATAPNRICPRKGITNLRLNINQSGSQLFHFTLPRHLGDDDEIALFWNEPDYRKSYPLPRPIVQMGEESNLSLGAIIDGDTTTFRLFAPKADKVTVSFWPKDKKAATQTLGLQPENDGIWEAWHSRSLEGWHYTYSVSGCNRDASTDFDPDQPLNDPYAKALASAKGPGIILPAEFFEPKQQTYRPPLPEDLQIVEVHLRDALAKAPIELTPEERRGFTGLAKWLRTGDTYFHDLGVNCIELQPVHEFDCESIEEYHWGYMPVNLFSPTSSYGLQPDKGSQVQEFQALVQAFHEQEFAVLLDVVLNHQGIHSPLQGIDKGYYFEMDGSQELLNWSGCGNDMRSHAPMVRRLLVDSLLHWVRAYDVDGFRLDLAELLDLETLIAIETTLRQEKPDIILIAEPWSFRGHSAKVLRSTSYSSWNDGFREFVFRYVQGKGTNKDLAYFLGGSQGHFATFPAQTVNYIESHDDRCWIDKITENNKYDGRQPTPLDIHRTHLAIGILHAALGIPMLSAGQDFLRSKHGVNNTYRRGDLNILDYDRENKFQQTVEYIRDWIRFRQSIPGSLLRRKTFPNPTNLRFFHSDDGSALAMHLWDGDRHLLFTIHPAVNPAEIHLLEDLPELWLVADEKRFYERESATYLSGESCFPLRLPPGSLRLWATH